MQTLRKDISSLKTTKDSAISTFHGQQRKSALQITFIQETDFSERLVEMVNNQYPKTGEEASVLISSVWNMIEKEIMNDQRQTGAKEAYGDRICLVSASYDLAAARLQEMNKPLLKPGAVAEYYRLLQ